LPTLDEQGQPQGQPLWLLVWGSARAQLTPAQGQQAYAQRFRLEHFFGFAKPHLLLTAFQTCHTPHEINAVRLAALAYGQLWLARHLVDTLPLPWQRYSPTAKTQQRTPRQVQRGFATLIQQLDSMALPPKTRGIPPGRTKGTRLQPTLTLSIGEVSPNTKALSLQGLAKVGLIIGFEELNACVLSTGSMLFVQNQSCHCCRRSPLR
jgi:hypothetical protein